LLELPRRPVPKRGEPIQLQGVPCGLLLPCGFRVLQELPGGLLLSLRVLVLQELRGGDVLSGDQIELHELPGRAIPKFRLSVRLQSVRRWDLLPGGIQSADGMPSRVLLSRWFGLLHELCHGCLLGRERWWLHVMRRRQVSGLDRHHQLQRLPRGLLLPSWKQGHHHLPRWVLLPGRIVRS
jgi:hypothetical protein